MAHTKIITFFELYTTFFDDVIVALHNTQLLNSFELKQQEFCKQIARFLQKNSITYTVYEIDSYAASKQTIVSIKMLTKRCFIAEMVARTTLRCHTS